MKRLYAASCLWLALLQASVVEAAPDDAKDTVFGARFALAEAELRDGQGGVGGSNMGLSLSGHWVGWSGWLGVEVGAGALAALPLDFENGVLGNQLSATGGVWARFAHTAVGLRGGADFAYFSLDDGVYQSFSEARFAAVGSVAARQRLGPLMLMAEAGHADRPFYSVDLGVRRGKAVFALGWLTREARFATIDGRVQMVSFTVAVID